MKLGGHADLYGSIEAATFLEVIEELEKEDGLLGEA